MTKDSARCGRCGGRYKDSPRYIRGIACVEPFHDTPTDQAPADDGLVGELEEIRQHIALRDVDGNDVDLLRGCSITVSRAAAEIERLKRKATGWDSITDKDISDRDKLLRIQDAMLESADKEVEELTRRVSAHAEVIKGYERDIAVIERERVQLRRVLKGTLNTCEEQVRRMIRWDKSNYELSAAIEELREVLSD